MIVVREPKPIIIKNKNFKRCILFISYPLEDMTIEERVILENIITDKSKKYDTYKKRLEREIKNSCLSYNSRINSIGDSYFFEIKINFPCIDAIKVDALEDNLLYAKELIYNSLIFDKDYLDKTSKETIDILKSKYKKTSESALKYYFHQNVLFFCEKRNLINRAIDNPNILDTVSIDKILNIYNRAIQKNPLIFLAGNVDEEKSIKTISKIFYFNNKKIEFDAKYKHYFTNIPSSVLEKEDKTNYESSIVIYNYKIRNIEGIKDEIFLALVCDLLYSNSSKILFKNLRTKNNLVYKCGIKNDYDSLTLKIWALTGKSNIDKVKDVINLTMKEISNIKYIDSKLDLIKEKAKTDKILDTEYLNNILFKEVDKYLECFKEDYYDEIKNITSDEILDFINNKLTLVSIYTGIGKSDN